MRSESVKKAIPEGVRGCWVYGLVDPITGQLRYVGATTAPNDRRRDHLEEPNGTVIEKTRLGAWIWSLRRKGKRPDIVWMEHCENRSALESAEEFWVFYHREEMGTDLLNKLPGGPTNARICFMVPFNGWVAHDGTRWRLDSIIKNSTIRVVDGPEVVGEVWGAERVPDEPEIFLRNGLCFLNTYVQPRVLPVQGEHPRIDKLLLYLTAGDVEAVRFLLHWMALKVQDPGRRNMTAIVLQGQQGTGKDSLALILREMIGRENTARIGQWNLETRFNATFVDKLLVIADEVVNRDNVFDSSSPLKQFITDETIRSEEKFAPNMEVPNRMSWVFTSNASVPVRVEGTDDRRYSIFRNMSPPSEEHRQMLSTFYGRDGLSEEFVRSEVASLMWDLVNLKVDEGFIRRPYENEARGLVIRAGQNSVDAFAEELREEGLEQMAFGAFPLSTKLPDQGWLQSGRCRSNVLFDIYTSFCERNNFGRFNSSKFLSELKRTLPHLKRVRANGERRECGSVQKDRNERPWVYDGLPTTRKVAQSAAKPSLCPPVVPVRSAEVFGPPPPPDARSIDEQFEELLKI